MNIIKKCWLNTRDLVLYNYGSSIKALVFENNKIKLIDKYNILFYLIKIIPFSIIVNICKCYNINIIYKMDSIYMSTDNKINHILPVILEFNILNNNNEKINISSNIKNFEPNIPLSFVLSELKIYDYNKLYIRYLKNGIQEKILKIDVDTPIYKILS
jgi:hypothetical protein